MNLITAVILGIVQGVTEFLPVSSSGHMVMAGKLLGYSGDNIVPYLAWFHLGTLVALILYFRKDLQKVLLESARLFIGALLNLRRVFRTARSGKEEPSHIRPARTNYRKMTWMLWVAILPTIPLGLLLHHAAVRVAARSMYVGAAFLITAVVLLVTDRVKARNLTPKNMTLKKAAVIGIAQGIAVFPGLSRAACTESAGVMCGFSKKNAIRFSYLLSIPAVIGAALIEIADIPVGGFGVFWGPAILGAAVSAVTGYFTIRFMMKFVRRHSFRGFSVYCTVAGIASIAAGFLK